MTNRVPPLRWNRLRDALVRCGFRFSHETASHYIMVHPGLPRPVPIGKYEEIGADLVTRMIRECGLTREQFLRALNGETVVPPQLQPPQGGTDAEDPPPGQGRRRPNRRRNPVEHTGAGYYAVLPRRLGHAPYRWALGPFRGERAYEVAGLVHGAAVDVQGSYVLVTKGPGFNPPRVGPFRTAREAAAVLGHLANRMPPPDAGGTGRPKAGRSRTAVRLVVVERSPGRPRPPAARSAVRPSRRPDRSMEKTEKFDTRQLERALQHQVEEAAGALRGLGYGKRESLAAAQEARARLGPAANTEALLRESFRRDSNPRPSGESAACPRCGHHQRVPRTAQAIACAHCGALLTVHR